jgi:hypothetical protein
MGYFLSLGLLPGSKIGQYSANTLHTVFFPSQITSWKLICCYKNIIKPKQKGIRRPRGVVTEDSVLMECCTLSTSREQVIKEYSITSQKS